MTVEVSSLAGIAWAAEKPSATKTNRAKPPSGAEPFFPFCIDTHDAKKRNLEEQAALLKELGYDGVGHLWLDNIPERLKTLDAAGLKLFQITMTVDIAGEQTAYDQKVQGSPRRSSKAEKSSFC